MKHKLAFASILLFITFLHTNLNAQPGCIGFNADFDYKKDSILFPPSIDFTNTSTWTDSTTNYRWNFDDGSSSFLKNESHTFYTQKVHNVCMYATNIKQNGDTTCRDSICKQITIEYDTCVLPPVSLLVAIPDPNSCFEYKFTTNTIGFYFNYLWDFGDSATDTLNRSPNHRYSAKGIYNVCLKTYYDYSNNRRCIDSACNDIDVCHNLSAEEIAANNGAVYLYPNPVSSLLNIEHNGYRTDINISIYDITGKQVSHINIGGQKQIDVSFLQTGIYFVTISSVNTIISHQKVMKQ